MGAWRKAVSFTRCIIAIFSSIFGFLLCCCALPALLRAPFLVSGKDCGMPWRLVSAMVVWILIAGTFVFLAMKGLWE